MNLRGLSLNTSLVVLFLALTACATDQQRTRTEGTAAGALGGAAIGALIGGKNAAGIGTLVGGAIGLMAGDTVAPKKAAYAKREAAPRSSADHAEQLARHQRQQNQIREGENLTSSKYALARSAWRVNYALSGATASLPQRNTPEISSPATR